MPWFPDFVAAAELARQETRVTGRTDPVSLYFAALNEGETRNLERAWPGEVVIHDPRVGQVRGHKELKRFVRHNQSWLAEREARIETVASTVADGRAVVELLAHLADNGGELAWPITVVAESANDRSVEFRTYRSQQPVDGQRHVRPPILEPGPNHPGDVVGCYLAALNAGDTDEIVKTFTPDGCFRESIGSHRSHRGTHELESYFSRSFGAGGGITLEYCTVTDDGVRCAVEYNCLRWGSHDLPPQAGLIAFERDPDGLLAVVGVYDDVEPPVVRASQG